MVTKSPEQKAIEKQIRESKQRAREAARRERAKAVVDAARYIGKFRIMNAEAETMLKSALEKLTDSSKYVVSVNRDDFDRNISDNFALVCEELQLYGAITSYMLFGNFVELTLSEAGKSYFENKAEAEKSVEVMTSNGRNIIFISHRSVDADVAEMIKDFLVAVGIPNDKVFCSSLPGNDVKEKISLEVKQRLKESTINILILSKDYYDSAYCLNEAGVAWYLDEAVAIPVCLPEINHENMIGFLSNEYKLRRLDNDGDISYLYDIAQERLYVDNVKYSVITREMQKLKERYALYISKRDSGNIEMNTAHQSVQVTLEKDEKVLLVYAACDPSGRIMMVTNISRLRPLISTSGWEFNNEDTAREAARWEGVLDNLERNGLIEATNYKRRQFAVTALGYKVAEQVKEKWDIDTNKDPKEYIE